MGRVRDWENEVFDVITNITQSDERATEWLGRVNVWLLLTILVYVLKVNRVTRPQSTCRRRACTRRKDIGSGRAWRIGHLGDYGHLTHALGQKN